MSDLEITAASGGNLIVSGDIDAATAAVFAEAVHALPSDIVIDLRSCSFMDSTGVSVLVEAKALAEARDAQFRLVEPSTAVARLLEVCGMSAVLGLPEGPGSG